MYFHTPKIVLITGASSGFGQEAARKFAGLNCKLVLLARRLDRLMQLKAELDTPCYLIECDITDTEKLEEELSNIPDEFKDIDLLINNAGLALGLEKAQEANLGDWFQMIDTNIKGLIACTRFILPRMIQNNSGHIINLGSIAGSYPYPGGHTYCGTKSFVKQFSLALRADLLGHNVRVTNIEPGMAATEFSNVRFKGDDNAAENVYDGTQPLVAEDIAEAIKWVATLPEHVNINRLEMMPTCQASGPLAVHRD